MKKPKKSENKTKKFIKQFWVVLFVVFRMLMNEVSYVSWQQWWRSEKPVKQLEC